MLAALGLRYGTPEASKVAVEVQKQLAMYCPIAKVIRNSGTVINENWNKID